MIVCEDCRKTTSGKCWRHGQITPPTSFCDEILPCLIHRTEATDLPDRAVQPDTPTMDQDARNALADATWLDRDGVNIEDAVKRLHRLGYTVVRAAAMTKEATR
jgi:hypothetical protein